jgi:DNA polymerase-3 subunit alpha
MGLDVSVPDVNAAQMNYYPRISDDKKNQRIIYGLSAIRNVGEGIVSLLISERNLNGPFLDFYDFCERVDMQVLNRRAIEALIKAGAYDSLGHTRQGLLASYEQIIDQTVSRRKEKEMGVMTLFEVAPEDETEVFNDKVLIPEIEFEKQQKLAFEKEMLGRYISDHPLRGYEGTIRRKCDATSLGIRTLDEGKVVKVGGVISEVLKKQTQRGDLMAIVSLEDLEGEIEVVVFTKAMNQVGHKLATDRPVIVTGRIDRRDEANTKVICLEIDELKSDEDSKVTSIEIKIPSAGTTTKHLENLSSLLSEHAGNCDVYVHLGSKRIWLGADVRVNPESGLRGELRVLFGADCLLP